MRPIRFLCTLIALNAGIAAVARGAEPTAGVQFFENRIHSILSENCYKCHSAAAGKTKNGLALDNKPSLLRGGKNGPAIVPGFPAQSLLIKAVGYSDPDLQMPPSGKLSPRQVADLTQWIEMGAPDPRTELAAVKLTGLTDKARAHWAFQPVRMPATPAVKHASWVRTPIDAFIAAGLEAKGMEPNVAADKETLLRRATFDLIGMPPTTDELQAFLADASPEAFARVVDRLLASPHYGERWGRYWLDTARYADTGGPDVRLDDPSYRFAYAWVYRDYVIDAFNSDKPYTRFILEQLAADQLPLDDDNSALAGLGFLTVGERFGNPDDVINDRIDVVSKGFLGLTVTCARCHDHKFDPIPTADYYSLHGIFNNVVEPAIKPVIGKPTAQTADYLAKVAELEQKNRDLYYATLGKCGKEFRQRAGKYMGVVPHWAVHEKTPEDYRLEKEDIEKYGIDAKFYGAGRLLNVGRDPQDAVWGPLVRFRNLSPGEFADKSKALAAEIAANAPRKMSKGAAIYNQFVAALFKDAEVKSFDQVEALYTTLFSSLEPRAQAYLAAKSGGAEDPISGYDPALVQLIAEPFGYIASPREVTFTTLLPLMKGWPQTLYSDVKSHSTFIEKNQLDLSHPGVLRRAMVLEDVARPKDSYIYVRGDPREKGKIVPRRFLEFLSGPNRSIYSQDSGRLELARAIASKDNPLTARVAVNRIWMHHFGEGIVPTPDDLGVQSEKPSHPELIDWMAGYFMENHWSFKKLHRMIMLSSVYQQSSRNNPVYAQVDPGNRLLWRANLRRLDFEATRDSLLVVSGHLDPTLGGQPINLTDEPYSFRRSVYGYVDRGVLPDLLQQFDFSDPRMPNSKRPTTIVPQQALFLMNSPMAADVSRKIVTRPEFTSAKDDAGRIAALYRIIFQRQPRPAELNIGREYVEDFNRDHDATGSRSTGAPMKHQSSQLRKDVYGRMPVLNQGQQVQRRPPKSWEAFAQTLLFANEAAFVK